MNVGCFVGPLDGSVDQTSTIDLLNEAQKRRHNVFVIHPENVRDNRWHQYQELDVWQHKTKTKPEHMKETVVEQLDVLLLRHDTPAPKEQVRELTNRFPETLTYNDKDIVLALDKKYVQKFSEFTPRTYFTQSQEEAKSIISDLGTAIVKLMDEAGGRGIYKLGPDHSEIDQILNTITQQGTEEVVVQEYLPEVREGDKRVVTVEGRPVAQFLRKPQKGSYLANIHAGGSAHLATLTRREQETLQSIADTIVSDGIYLGGVDFIGERLIEVNAVCPGYVLLKETPTNTSSLVMDSIEQRVKRTHIKTSSTTHKYANN